MKTIKLFDLFFDENNVPHLKTIEEYYVENNCFEAANCISFLVKELRLNRKRNEYVYIVSTNDGMSINGVIKIAQGNAMHAEFSKRVVASYLLLIGATSFIMVHNHPNNYLCASDDDFSSALMIHTLGNLCEVKFQGSYISVKNDYMRVTTPLD